MKRTLLILLSATSLSGYALAAPEGYYLGGFGEINITDRDKDQLPRFDFIDDGKGLGLEFGYFYNSRWGGRIEWSALDFDSAGGDVTGDRYGIDALYRLTENGPVYAIMGLKHLEAGNGHSAINLGLGAHQTVAESLTVFAEGAVYGGLERSFTDFGAKLGVRYHFSDGNDTYVQQTPVQPAQTTAAAEYQAEELKSNAAPVEQPVAAATQVPVDLDQDGVADDLDLCPDSAPEFAVDQNGCVILERVPVTVKLEILFANNSSQVSTSDRREIAKVAEFMHQHSEGRVEIAGHSSARGDAGYNMALSHARAKAVADILVTEMGIAPERVSAKGYGETRLLDLSGTDAAERRNRRIEAVFSTTELRKKPR